MRFFLKPVRHNAGSVRLPVVPVIFAFFTIICSTSVAQSQSDTIITTGYFGFDFWGVDKDFWAEVFAQMNSDSFPFDLVGTDALNWQKLEPDTPAGGLHTYYWAPVDSLVYEVFKAGKKLELGFRPLSNWGTVLPADSVPQSDWSLVMSPVLPDNLSHVSGWGMTAAKAWQDMVYYLIERYDGDGVNDMPPGNQGSVNYNLIKTLMIGNEPEAAGHFFAGNNYDPGGNVAELTRIMRLTYDSAKLANPDVLVVRGKSNPGHIFDDIPDNSTVYNRRPGLFDSLYTGFSAGTAYYDLFAFNYNDNYTSLLGYSNWVRQAMDSAGISRPFMVGDARTTLYPRDNFFIQNKIMPSIYMPSDTFLVDTSSPGYQALKKQWQKDKVQQSIRKMAVAGTTGQYQISLQPVYVGTDFHQGDPRTYMWMYSGFFDPYIYENTGSLALAREPLYWSAKMFAGEVMGALKQAVDLNIGGHVFAYRYIKPQGDDPVVIWHEDFIRTDPVSGLLQRNQDTVVDLSSAFGTQYVRMKPFITEVDSNGLPVPVNDTIVPAAAVPVNEFPVILLPESGVKAGDAVKNTLNVDLFPNPAGGCFSIRTDYRGVIEVEIVDLKGNVLRRLRRFDTGAALDVSAHELAAGIYIVNIYAGGEVLHKKLIRL